MHLFPKFLLSGTGINFELYKELMESGSMKAHQVTEYKVIFEFQPLSKLQVVSFATQFLQEHQVADCDEIVSRISSFELCHGRPRFLAYIIDSYMESRNIDFSFGQFIYGISSVEGQIFPLRFWKRDLEETGYPLANRTIGGDTLLRVICDGLLQLILKGELLFQLTNADAATAIRYGLGFGMDCPMHLQCRSQL
jgi:hypothetical protein